MIGCRQQWATAMVFMTQKNRESEMFVRVRPLGSALSIQAVVCCVKQRVGGEVLDLRSTEGKHSAPARAHHQGFESYALDRAVGVQDPLEICRLATRRVLTVFFKHVSSKVRSGSSSAASKGSTAVRVRLIARRLCCNSLAVFRRIASSSSCPRSASGRVPAP